MNHPILYQPNGRKKIWLALCCAIAIHIGAIAISAGRSERSSIACVFPGKEVVVTVDESETPPPPIDVPIPDVPNIPPPEEGFRETPPPPQRTRTTPIAAIRTANGTTSRTASFHSIKPLGLWAPKPPYPYEARHRQITGSGVATLEIDAVSGNVMGAAMAQSTGSIILDSSTLSTLRRWRFKAGTPARVQVPITFTLTGASF